MEQLAARMERGEDPPCCAGTTSSPPRFEGLGGYDTDTAEDQGVQRPSIGPGMREQLSTGSPAGRRPG